MIVYPRSFWTASLPRPSLVGDEFEGLPYFDLPPVGIEFCTPEDEILYVYRNPANELERLRSISVQGTGLSDINYNYALSQNTEGVYVLRGGITKCIKTNRLRVLLLMGRNEKPTDTLKRNQEDFLSQKVTNPFPTTPLSVGDSNVHVFNLIEYLAEYGYFQSRNNGVYSMIVEHAIQKFQKDTNLTITGQYNEWIVNKLQNKDREYIES